jgi:DNA-binding response OmpR family regulator
MRLLMIEDNKRLAEYVSTACRAKGFAVDLVASVADGHAAIAATNYDAVILDLGLPDGDGLSWLQAIRRENQQTPVLILTARDGSQTVVDSLNLGADDYLSKPFEFDVLIARIRALLRRPGRVLSVVLAEGNVTFDTSAREVRIDDQLVELGRREMDGLELLMRRTGRVVPKVAIEDAIYAFGDEVASNAIEVLIHRLRKRLRDAGGNIHIHTVRGVGYLLSDSPS